MRRCLKWVALGLLFAAAILGVVCHIPGFPVQIGMSSGPCMEPTLHGWQLLVFVHREPKLGDIVLADWGEGWMVKRVAATGALNWSLIGDNHAESEFCFVSPKKIQGVLVWPVCPVPKVVDRVLHKRYLAELYKLQAEHPGLADPTQQRSLAWKRAIDAANLDHATR